MLSDCAAGGKGASGPGCGKGYKRKGKNLSRMTKDEIYETAKTEGKEVRMCNGTKCTALGFMDRVHWMSKERAIAEKCPEKRTVCGRFKDMP